MILIHSTLLAPVFFTSLALLSHELDLEGDLGDCDVVVENSNGEEGEETNNIDFGVLCR